MSKNGETGFARVMDWLSLGGIVCLLCEGVMLTADAVMRGFGHPIMGVGELTPLLSAVAVASFLPLSMREDSHISVRLLLSVRSPTIRWVVGMFGLVASLAVLLLIGRGLVLYASASFRNGTTTGFLPVPIAPSWALVSILVLFAALVQAWIILRKLRGTKYPASDASGDEETGR